MGRWTKDLVELNNLYGYVVGNFCRNFRLNHLRLSLSEVAEISGENIRNLRAFEDGRATAFRYIFAYYDACDDILKEDFARGFFNLSFSWD